MFQERKVDYEEQTELAIYAEALDSNGNKVISIYATVYKCARTPNYNNKMFIGSFSRLQLSTSRQSAMLNTIPTFTITGTEVEIAEYVV